MISGPENYRDFQETGPWDQAPSWEKMTNDRKQEANRAGKEASLTPGLSDCVDEIHVTAVSAVFCFVFLGF